MYQVYLGGLLLPIAPARIQTTVNGRNETIELFNGQEVNVIKPTGLTEISFEFIIPHRQYPFATDIGKIVTGALGSFGFNTVELAIKQYLQYLKSGQFGIVSSVKALLGQDQQVTTGEPFQFIVVDIRKGSIDVKANIKVTLENYEIIEDADEHGFDSMASVTLKEYVPYGTKIINDKGNIVKRRGK